MITQLHPEICADHPKYTLVVGLVSKVSLLK